MASSPYPPLDRERAAKYGPWAVISGASDGTGEAFARQLAALGINVLLIARRQAVLEALAADIRAAHGVETRILVQDLMDPAAAGNILEAAADLDVGLYVSNAGADGVGASFLDNPAERWRRMVNMNVLTVIDLTHGFGQRMVARGRGGMLLMSSMSALRGLPWMTMYAATKGFEMGFAEGLWGELQQENVDMLAVLAPCMDTPCFRTNTAGTNFDSMGMIAQKPDDVVRQALARLPHGPLLMFPAEPGSTELEPMTEERRQAVLAAVNLGQSFFGKTDT
jgi:short-subunit dehydrogenase